MQYKTPGVYIKDLTLPQPADPLVESALPAFLGYTEFARDEEGKDIHFQAFRIRDLEHFNSFFGGAYRPDSYEVVVDPQDEYAVKASGPDHTFYLYDCLQQYFDNDGGDCFIISIGSFEDLIERQDFLDGLNAAIKTPEITIILYPDAVQLSVVDLGSVQQASLQHCFEQKNRFLIADIKEGEDWLEDVGNFREAVGINQLKYGAAYFPWLYSTYDHQFHFRELKFKDVHTGDEIRDYSRFSNESDLALARVHQQMVAQVLLAGEYISNIINCLEISEINRDNLSPLTEHWNHKLKAVPDTTEEKEHMNFLARNLEFFSEIIRTFPRLDVDDKLPDDLSDYLFDLKADKAFVEYIASTIGLAKAAENEGLFTDDFDIHAIEAVYSDLAGTNWLTYDSITDVPLFADWGDVLSEDKISQIAFVNNKADEYAQKILPAFSGLFDLAISHEALAEAQLFSEHPFFKRVFDHLNLSLKRLPPSGSMAGIYSATDQSRGVWKAPANIRLNATLGPVIEIDDHDQENLNVHTTGKSINVIRPFRGRGIRIWGARTLAGNDNEWRYVPVRRFFNFVEDFVKLAAEPFVFEPNDANTWMKFRFMLDNFLTAQWRKGALVGLTTNEAYFINLGLDESMTQQDILEGRMIVEIGLAVARPAEFIVVRYLCRMENT